MSAPLRFPAKAKVSLHQRLLIPAMGILARDHVVNQLAAEAVAAAAYLETSIEVEIDTPHLRVAADAEQLEYHVV